MQCIPLTTWILFYILITCRVKAMLKQLQPENVQFYSNPGTASGFRRLNKAENDAIQKVCGKSYYGPKYHPESNFKVASAVSAVKGQFPWLVALGEKNAFCTGTLISARHIVTAAHCITEYEVTKIPCEGINVKQMPKTISYGGICVDEGEKCPEGNDMQKANVRQIAVVRSFNDDSCNSGGDLAVIELEKNVDIDAYTIPVCLGYLDKNDLNVTIDLGFGRINEKDKSINLRYIITRLSITKKAFTDGKDVLYTYSAYKNAGTSPKQLQPSICSGDSGGPLTTVTAKYPGRTFLAGTHSFTSGCGKKDGMNGSTNMLFYIDFLCALTGVCPDKPAKG
uniref:Peptidase S1 domain-containing protein n=1 Tax=Panagrellus redivivus TaxID=6233 RepID=A0A7E4ZU07_PANRE